MLPSFLDFCPSPFAKSFKPEQMRLSYCTCAFPVTKLFTFNLYCNLLPWSWPKRLTYFWEIWTLATIFKAQEIRLSYFTFIFLNCSLGNNLWAFDLSLVVDSCYLVMVATRLALSCSDNSGLFLCDLSKQCSDIMYVIKNHDVTPERCFNSTAWT